MSELLLDGVNHIGMVTDDTERLVAFYRERLRGVRRARSRTTTKFV